MATCIRKIVLLIHSYKKIKRGVHGCLMTRLKVKTYNKSLSLRSIKSGIFFNQYYIINYIWIWYYILSQLLLLTLKIWNEAND